MIASDFIIPSVQHIMAYHALIDLIDGYIGAVVVPIYKMMADR
jgi:hypothetical protein